MLENLLKELGEHHFEVLWKYDFETNSIIIQMDKKAHQRRLRVIQKVSFDAFRCAGLIYINVQKSSEFIMIQILKEMALNLEQAFMKGETMND